MLLFLTDQFSVRRKGADLSGQGRSRGRQQRPSRGISVHAEFRRAREPHTRLHADISKHLDSPALGVMGDEGGDVVEPILARLQA